jgi:prevent-host-death family protein
MKTIPIKKLQTDLDAVLKSSQKERILISRDGKPCAVLVGVEDYDTEDLRLATSPDFWLMIRQRRIQGSSVPLAEVESRLAGRGGESPGEPSSARTKRPRG